MTPASSPTEARSSVNTRRHARYRLTERILLHCSAGSTISAVTKDISISGISLVCSGLLNVGETVELDRVVELRVQAVVRHRTNDFYGLEFVDAPAALSEAIIAMCRGLFRLSHSAEEQTE